MQASELEIGMRVVLNEGTTRRPRLVGGKVDWINLEINDCRVIFDGDTSGAYVDPSELEREA